MYYSYIVPQKELDVYVEVSGFQILDKTMKATNASSNIHFSATAGSEKATRINNCPSKPLMSTEQDRTGKESFRR